MGMAFGGAVLAWARLNLTNFNWYRACVVLLVAFCGFEGAKFINDAFDIRTDITTKKENPILLGLISKSTAIILGIALSVLSLLLSMYLGTWAFIFVILTIILHLLYSLPPFRLKRIFPLQSIILAFEALFAMFTGYSSLAPNNPLYSFPIRMIVLVLFTLSLAFNTKDIRDIEGDKKEKIKNLYTLFGIKKGKLINAILVLIAYLSTPIITDYIPLFIVALPCGVATAGLIMSPKYREEMIFGIYIPFGLLIMFLIYKKILFV